MSLKDNFEQGYREGMENAELGCNLFFLFLNGINHIAWLMYGLIVLPLWLISGVITCLTVVGIRFSGIIFDNSTLTIRYSYKRWSGVRVKLNYKKAPIANIIWAVTFGWVIALLYVSLGIVFCSSLMLIPSGLQFFKAAKNALLPFGAEFI